MRRLLVGLAALATWMVGAGEAQATTTYSPAYEAGAQGGDIATVAMADPASGSVTIVGGPHFPTVLGCTGQGPFATLVVTHRVKEAAERVEVDYRGVFDGTALVTVAVSGSERGPLGSRHVGPGPEFGFGPGVGTLDLKLRVPAVRDESLRVEFGLQAPAACVNGSEGLTLARADFPAVRVS